MFNPDARLNFSEIMGIILGIEITANVKRKKEWPFVLGMEERGWE
jgi:hypothetical protein